MSLQSADVTTVDAIPVTTPARTLIDIASIVTRDTLEEILDDALRRNLVSVSWLRWRLREIGTFGRDGSGVIARLVEARAALDTVPQSVFETRLLRLLRGAGLPLPVVQYRLRTRRGVAVLDFAYVEQRIAIEADGFIWHSSRRQWDHDRDRGNALIMLGWIVIRVTWTQLRERPDEVVDTIGSVLASRT
jgi:very-short-patch-repair endonuclease